MGSSALRRLQEERHNAPSHAGSTEVASASNAEMNSNITADDMDGDMWEGLREKVVENTIQTIEIL